jgi:hypothetical protein
MHARSVAPSRRVEGELRVCPKPRRLPAFAPHLRASHLIPRSCFRSTRHYLPSRNARNLLKGNDRASFYSPLKRRISDTMYLPQPQITRHTMPSNFHAISLKTNDGCTKEVTHKLRYEVRPVGRGFNPAVSDALASLPFAPLYLRELPGLSLTNHQSRVTNHSNTKRRARSFPLFAGCVGTEGQRRPPGRRGGRYKGKPRLLLFVRVFAEQFHGVGRAGAAGASANGPRRRRWLAAASGPAGPNCPSPQRSCRWRCARW